MSVKNAFVRKNFGDFKYLSEKFNWIELATLVGVMCWYFEVFVMTRADEFWMRWSLLRFACEMREYGELQ